MIPSIYKEIQGFVSKYASHKEVIEALYLIAFINAFDRVKAIEGIATLSENEIRDKFQYDFEHHNSVITEYLENQTITFDSESQIIEEHEKYRTDIKLFCAWYRKQFVIECKLLRFASQVYIQGKYNKSKEKYEVNGIERYITLTYAKDDEYAGMMGFIIQGNPEKIVKKLSHKVKSFHPSNEMELLKQECADWKLSFQSKHIRVNDKAIHLYHLFFDFVNHS